MNDDNKTANQNVDPVAQTNQVQSQAPLQPAQPAVPSGLSNKEVGPVGTSSSEFVKPSGAEIMPNISPEVSKHVEVNNDKPNLTPEHKDLVDHAGPNIAVPSSFSNKVSLPMSEEEMAEQLKTGEDDDSGKWLAELVRKIIAWGLKTR